MKKFDEALQEEKMEMEKLRKKNRSSAGVKQKKSVEYIPSLISEIADEIQPGLNNIYQKSGALMTVQKVKEIKSWRKIPSGLNPETIIIRPINLKDLQARINLDIKFFKTNENNRRKSCSCPQDLANQILGVPEKWKFPVLSGISCCPCLTGDGSILKEKGYDKKSGLYAAFDPDQFPPIPENPSKEKAQEELEKIRSLLSEFTFKTPLDEAVYLAALFTITCRKAVPHAPMFAFTSPLPGTGKSTLADLISILSAGRAADPLSYSQDEETLKKQLFALFLTDPAIVLLDNIEEPVKSSSLCIILTQENWQERILGESKTVSISPTAIVICTGNNLEITGDLVRRSLYCRLDADLENPEERDFSQDIYACAKQKRGSIITSILTIQQAYKLANFPKSKNIKRMANFEEWSQWTRGPLFWLGLPDPLESQKQLKDMDSTRNAKEEAFAKLYSCLAGKKFTSREICQACENNQELREAFEKCLPAQNSMNPRIIGKWLLKNCDGIIAGYQLCKEQKYNNVIYWTITAR